MLKITGRVDRPSTYRLEDLAALPGQIPDVSERLAGRRGRGVLLSCVLAPARPQDGARRLELTSVDGTFSVAVDLAEAAEAILVYGKQDGPLPEAEGGPIRFFLHDAEACRGHGDAPCANVKGLGRIVLVD